MMQETVPSPASMASFGRACRGEHYSGDLAYVHDHDAGVFLAIVDAAGHGRSAHCVATEIEKILRSEDTNDLAALIQSMHQQLMGGPGAVVIAGFLDTENMDFTFVHIGDVHGKIFGPRHRTLVGQAGMLGHAIRTPNIQRESLFAADTLVLCTDGISERYDLAEVQGHRRMSTDVLARQIVKQFGKDHDDATCIVVKCG